MSNKPVAVIPYKSNPVHRGGIKSSMEHESKLTNFATDLSKSRTGFYEEDKQMQLGGSVIRNGPIGAHSFLSTPMIDNSPDEKQGTGIGFEFRSRDRSKEIPREEFSMYSPSRIKTFDEIKQ